MSRPLRLEFDGALYHVTTRGNRRQDIFRDDSDRLAWFSILGDTCARFNFAIYAFCQMTNHYHLLVETADANLGAGMGQLNSRYAQYFNRRHSLVGHAFQGRYKAILCQSESYLTELARYIVLNPVRAGIVASPEAWPWSSHRMLLGEMAGPAWLHAPALLAHFGEELAHARHAYSQFVYDGIDSLSPLRKVSHQLFLGDADFVERSCQTCQPGMTLDVVRQQLRPFVRPLADYFRVYAQPAEAMARAYQSQVYSLREIARFCRTSARTVSRQIRQFEQISAYTNTDDGSLSQIK